MHREPELLPLRKKRRVPPRACACEPLESRIAPSVVGETPQALDELLLHDTVHYPGGVTVTETQILTPTETIPRFAAAPTISNVKSGAWNDAATWSAGRVPTTGDRVVIAENTTVTYAQVSDARIDAIEVSGWLLFAPNVSTRLVVANLTVMPLGRLQIGSESTPVAAGVTAELVIADQPLAPLVDPRQYGTGLIVLGRVTIHGQPLATTWLRLAAEPRAGDRSLILAGGVPGWKPQDRLVLPDTRQVLSSREDHFLAGLTAPEWEEVVIDRIEGHRVFLRDAVRFDHLGARNTAGQLELLPHVAHLDRNVILRSQNAQGTRGHTFYTARASVDIRYASFRDLGRTDAFKDLDNTVLDSQGRMTHWGTNQVGRYAVHFHHLLGPVNPSNAGYQYQFVGNAVENSRKWAVAIHDTSFGLIDRSVVYGAQGAGFVTEDGSEIGNLIRGNIAIRIQGTHVDGKEGTLEEDYARGGSGFWFRRGGNVLFGNVAADATYAGFVFSGYYTDQVLVPLFRGADKREPGQGVTRELSPATYALNNEAYGMTRLGLWAAFISGNNWLPNQPQTTFRDLRFWHTHAGGVVGYHLARVTFDRLLVLGDRAQQDRNNSGTRGIDLKNYESIDIAIRNSRIEGVYYGVIAPVIDGTRAGVERPTVIENSTLKSYINISVAPPRDAGSSQGNVLEVRNVKFELLTQLPPGPVSPDKLPSPANISMSASDEKLNWTQPSIVRVYSYNGVAGDDFQVYYHQQHASFVLPRTPAAALSGREAATIGAPQQGLTNAQAWTRYGIAMAGAVAPAAAAVRPGINGLVAPIQDLSLLAPRVVLVTPWHGAVIEHAYPLRIRYNIVGLMPDGARAYFQFDGGQPFSQFVDGGIAAAPGVHVLRAYIGDSSGNLWPGQQFVSHTIRVLV